MVERRFRAAWSRADVKLTASRFMGVEERATAGGNRLGALPLNPVVKTIQ
jgi:hypothetical protein